MPSIHRVDSSTLGWVKSEIDQTLEQTWEALQRYADGDGDVTPLRLFANSVHQVAGTLQMVELDGAAQLARETESLASAVVSGKTDDSAEAAGELLRQGLTRLSTCMEDIAGGRPDRPVDNVELISALRRARGAEELELYAYFHPDLEIYPTRDKPPEALEAEEYARRLRALRQRFQGGLLQWLRDQDDEAAWQELADVTSEVYELSRFQVSMQIWWVSRAYLDVVKDEKLAQDDPRKHPLAKMDQLLRQLTEESEAAIARDGAETLVRYMLYQIGRSEVRTDTVRSVVRLFELDILLGRDAPPGEASDAAAAAGGEPGIADAGEAQRAAASLAEAERRLEQFARDAADTDSLAAVAESLQQVHDALPGPGNHGLRDLLELAIEQTRTMRGGNAYPSEALMDALAVAIGTADACLQGAGRGVSDPDTLVNRAMRELERALAGDHQVDADPAATLARIRESFDVWVEDNADYEAFRTLRRSLRDIGVIAHQQERTSLRRIAQEMTNLLDIVTDDPSFLSKEVEETLRRSLATLSKLSESLAPAAATAPAEPDDAADNGDALVRETFAEEARACLEDIAAGLDTLGHDHRDDDALARVRRNFHTIKGSGRMARARNIAELAWLAEDALNRCLNGEMPVDQAVVAFAGDARRELSGLLDQGLDSSTDLPDWRRRAAALQAAGEPAAPGAVEAGRDTTAPDPETGDLRSSDDELIQIFCNEASSHIAVIRESVEECRRRGEAAIDGALLRAVHTLQGNARSLHLVEMSQAYSELEPALRAGKSNGSLLEARQADTLDALLNATGRVLDHLNQDKRFPDVVRRELMDIADDIRAAWGRDGHHAGEPAGLAVAPDLARPGEAAARPATPAPSADEPAEADDLKDVFVEEATDVLARFESSLQAARDDGLDDECANVLKRELHTLKGSARAAGMEQIGTLSHDAESMLEGVAASGPPPDLLETLEEVHDTLANMVQGLEAGRTVAPAAHLVERLQGAAGEAGAPQAAAAGPDAEQPLAGRGTVRIRSRVLDKLVNYAGEVSIARAQLEEQLRGLKTHLNELRVNAARFSDQVRELDIQADTQIRARAGDEQMSQAGHDFDPLELDRYSRLQQLSRSLSESVDDLMTIQSGLNRFASRTENVLSHQAILNSELQDGLMSARMLPFKTLAPRLRHQARQTARELSKAVDFTVTGGDVEVDRNILDQLSGALEHMIRNAVDHGIEDGGRREAAGKPARGGLRIDCRQEGNEVLLAFSDDGRGLDVERIKARAAEAGLLAGDAELSADAVIQLIVLSGFSTSRSVTQLSGRGVGLDVVNDAVRRLGGGLTVDNRPGEGVTFELRLPLSLSITRAMFVRCGTQRFAIPIGAIERVLNAEPAQLTEVSKDGDPQFRHEDKTYDLLDLAAALALEPAPDKRVPVLLVRMGAREIAVRVDELIETDEIVVKQLGSHLAGLPGINGATITADGAVVLILDVAALWLAAERIPELKPAAPQDGDAQPRVMVVDDSLTVRKVTGRNLARNGMEVTMARDGIDALDELAKARPDLMLVDIEMPRMDGYELIQRVREDDDYRDIPIIVITSRAGAKHREKAVDLGAHAFLTKPYQEAELLEAVSTWLHEAPQRAESR